MVVEDPKRAVKEHIKAKDAERLPSEWFNEEEEAKADLIRKYGIEDEDDWDEINPRQEEE